MLTTEKRNQYQPTIGIECHVQLKTKTKLFSAVSNDAIGKEPNTVVSPICFGLPGVLPVLNEAVVELAIKAGLALNAEIANFSKFDRKHYFYPDLPKGYQITQFDQPIVGKGCVDVSVDGEMIKVGITRAHLEEDAGKSTHPAGADYSLVDLNRAGTPLLEIVSEPDMHSAKAARAYAQELFYLMKYADVSYVNLFHGNMRFDVNVSVAKKGSKELGNRAEVKNINSFKAVEKAAEYEIKRQIELLEKGQEIIQETRGWDDSKQKTLSQRGKEDAHDYRYFPEPDLPPIVITEEEKEKVRSNMPLMPNEWRNELTDVGLDKSVIEEVLAFDAEDERVSYLGVFEILRDDKELAKKYANWVVNIFGPLQREKGMLITDNARILHIVKSVYDLVIADKLSSTNAKQLLRELVMLKHSPNDIEGYASQKGLIQVSDTGEIEKIVAAVLSVNEKAANDVKNGEMKAIGFLVGQVMKNSKGKANPQMAQELIKKQLGV